MPRFSGSNICIINSQTAAQPFATLYKETNMTPAIQIAKRAKIKFTTHEYDHDPSNESYGEEAATKLGVDSNRIFKTLVISTEGKGLAVAVLPVSTQLNMKLFAKAVGVKKTVMADKKVVEKTTGYVLGGVSPIGQKKKLRTIIESSAKSFETIYVSAGRRGLQIELSPNDLVSLTDGKFDSIAK
jgi:Cys-tRNA(Pro)/Cys-tRNA(Cys) deacylase